MQLRESWDRAAMHVFIFCAFCSSHSFAKFLCWKFLCNNIFIRIEFGPCIGCISKQLSRKNFITLHRTKFSITKKNCFLWCPCQSYYIQHRILSIFIFEWTNILSFGYSSIKCTHRWLTFTSIAILQFHLHLKCALLMTCVCPCCVPMHKEAGHSYLSLHCQVLQRFTRSLHTCDETAAHEADHSSEQTHILNVIWLLQHWIHALQVADFHRTNTVLPLAFEHALVCVLVVYPCTRKQVTHASLYTVRCSRHSLEVYAWWNSCP